MMTIMMNEVINVNADHSLSLRHKPEIFHGRLGPINKFTTPFELLLIAMWPSSLPDEFNGTPMHSVFSDDNRSVCLSYKRKERKISYEKSFLGK